VTIADMRDPFHASITPQAYATGAATVIAWMLVIMLIITPRTFFVGGASGRSGLMGRRGMIGGASGGGSVIGVGSRPWLQKVAALTVAVSLTLATADTFKIAQRQYEEGFMDAVAMRNQVVTGMEIKVSRIISDIFIWLAQVQTLIRLFPRHKEKVIIKWVGFALILFDIAFSALNSFGPYRNDNPSSHRFRTAIPALSYLFQLSLSMLYAAWVLYYAVTKRRYAFYHSMMWNIAVVALLSIVAIFTPVIFFITDISNDTIAGWGDYFRWVGTAAASVIVWEWVERIEALEREERKDGILGREVYDGDEMLDATPFQAGGWPGILHRSRKDDDLKKSGDGGRGPEGGVFSSGSTGHGFSQLAHRLRPSRSQQQNSASRMTGQSIHIPAPVPAARRSESAQRSRRNSRNYLPLQTPPLVPVVSSPVSRTDTTSADSTVYTVRYHPISSSPAVGENPISNDGQLGRTTPTTGTHNVTGHPSPTEDLEKATDITEQNDMQESKRWNWQMLANSFRRQGRSPPPEVQRGRVIEPLGVEDVTVNIPQRNYTGLALKDRLGTFAAQHAEKLRSKKKTGEQAELKLPVTIIPAQPRGRTWSPEILLQLQQQQDALGYEQSDLQPDVSVSAGLHLQGETPLLVAATDEDRSSPMSNESADSGHNTASSPSNYTTHVRFAPETFQSPNAWQDVEWSTQPQSLVALGSELRDFQPQPDISYQPTRAPTTRLDDTRNRQHTPTNHDR
jgi:hypothetical protein